MFLRNIRRCCVSNCYVQHSVKAGKELRGYPMHIMPFVNVNPSVHFSGLRCCDRLPLKFSCLIVLPQVFLCTNNGKTA